jgi:glutathione synthase
MSLRVAVQMDPLATINVAGDSTFAIMLAGQKLGHVFYHYLAPDLTWEGGRLYAQARPVTVRRPEPGEPAGSHFTAGDPVLLDLGRDIDVVLMRQDPPFDLGYITAAHLLERLEGETLVINNPASVRNAPEKVWVLDFARFMPPTMVTRSLDATRRFMEQHGDIVIKPLHGNGGKAVFRVPAGGANLGALVEVFGQMWVEPFMVQAFLPNVTKGDKRIVLVDGEIAGAINRKPGEGEFRSNLAVGGSAEATELTPREREICAALAPELRARGLVFVGIDVIGGEWLTEINVTSPTGIVAIDRFNGTDTGALIWAAIDRRHKAMIAA